MALCLPGRQNPSPVGRIRRLRRHPALCPVALRFPGLQNLSPVGRIRRLCRHPALCPVALCLPGLQNLSPVGRIRRLRRHPAPCRWRFAYRAYKIHSRRPDKAFAPPSGAMPGGASLTGPTKPLSRRPDKVLVPPSGAMPGGASLTGPTKPLSRRPDKALAPPSGVMPVALCLPGLQNFSPIGKKKPPLREAFCFAVNRWLFPAEFTGERFLYLHNAEQHCADSEGYAPVTQRQRFCAKQHLHERHIDNRQL